MFDNSARKKKEKRRIGNKIEMIATSGTHQYV